MSSKKLTLSDSKCAKLHVNKGIKHPSCPELKVHGDIMKSSDQEKYLGEILNSNTKPHVNIVERISKGYGILANIKGLINDIPLGKRRIEIGLELRQTWLINACLFNSEVWQKLTKKEMTDLSKIDHFLLRSILGAHPKVATEMLHLETSTLPFSYIISCRRLIYLKCILDRAENEVTKKVYFAMKMSPSKNDWSEMILEDFKMIGEPYNENLIVSMSQNQYKLFIKKKIRNAAFQHLINLQQTHTKICNINYTQLDNPQLYLLHPDFDNEMCSLLFNLRGRTVRNIKDNFHGMYSSMCCDMCGLSPQNQEHMLECQVLKQHIPRDQSIRYEHIYGSVEQQRNIVTLYAKLLKQHEILLNNLANRGSGNICP